MMLTKQVVLSQIEVLPSGVVRVRLEKQVVEDGQILAMQYHRTLVEPGVDPDVQFAAVDAHLASLGFPPTDPAAVARVKRIVAIEHPPEVVAAYQEALLAAQPAVDPAAPEPLVGLAPTP
jgi:hypothetical protein